jgi:hypothetical protein
MSRFTEKQGQYLAFICMYTYMYALVNERPPEEADMQRVLRGDCSERPPKWWSSWNAAL